MFQIYDGVDWSYPAYVTVTIEPVNDNAPAVDLVPANQPFIEGTDGVQLLADVMLRDLDHSEVFNLTEAHVSLLEHAHTLQWKWWHGTIAVSNTKLKGSY